MSTRRGTLSLIHITMIRTRPTTKAKLVKLCTYFASCATTPKLSGPISGIRTILPNVMLSPVNAEDHEGTAR